MAKNPEPKPKPQRRLTAKEQSERFIQTAREVNVDEIAGNFDRVFEKIVPPKPHRSDN